MPDFPASRTAPGHGAPDPDRCRIALRCLIVDDSPRFLQSARAFLEREGIAVVGVASTGAEALQSVKQLRPDVTLLDVEFGGESGLDLVRRLQHQTALEPSSVILISSYAEEDFADLITASPAAGFLSKSNLSARAIRELLSDTGDGDHRQTS